MITEQGNHCWKNFNEAELSGFNSPSFCCCRCSQKLGNRGNRAPILLGRLTSGIVNDAAQTAALDLLILRKPLVRMHAQLEQRAM
jgi:hypothetical protein